MGDPFLDSLQQTVKKRIEWASFPAICARKLSAAFGLDCIKAGKEQLLCSSPHFQEGTRSRILQDVMEVGFDGSGSGQPPSALTCCYRVLHHVRHVL